MSTGQLTAPELAGSPQWLRLARRARLLSWLTLGWLGIEAAVGVAAAIIAGSVALLGFGLDSGIEALASIVVIWRFTGSRLAGPLSERRAQKLVAVSFWLLAPYIAVEGIQGLVSGSRPETSWVGIALTAGTFLLEPPLGIAKRRLGQRLGSAATAGEGTQNLLCAYLAGAVFIGLVANTAFGWWWLDGTVALMIAAWAAKEELGHLARRGMLMLVRRAARASGSTAGARQLAIYTVITMSGTYRTSHAGKAEERSDVVVSLWSQNSPIPSSPENRWTQNLPTAGVKTDLQSQTSDIDRRGTSRRETLNLYQR